MKFKIRIAVVTNTMKKDIEKDFGKNPNFPNDPDKLDELLKHLDSLVPQNQKTKLYVQYLLKQMWEVTPPGFTLGEDEANARTVLFSFDKYCTQGKLSGDDAQLKSYPTLGDLTAKIKSFAPKDKEREVGADYHSQYDDEQKAKIAAGAEVIYNNSGWIGWKCVGTPQGKAAAGVLCNNPLNDVSWCVGRGATGYLDAGPFYILEYDGFSAYAISSQTRGYGGGQATIWNRHDAVIWVTSTKEDAGQFASLKAVNSSLNMSLISALPVQILPVLQGMCKKDKDLASMIPEGNFKVDPDSFKQLDKAILAADKTAFSKELNNSLSNARTMGLGTAVLSRCIALHFEFDWSKLSENSIISYIELYGGTGEKSLPKSFSDYILAELQKD